MIQNNFDEEKLEAASPVAVDQTIEVHTWVLLETKYYQNMGQQVD